MSFVAVAVGTAAVTTGVSGYLGYKSSKDAASAQAAASGNLAAMMNLAAEEVDEYSQQYIATLDKLDKEFDPYDMEQAFNSLYEAVIQPMERDFDENVLPQIQAAYSGGVMGASAGLSGAASEAESRAVRGQAETKAQLRYQERDKGIARNYAEYERRNQLAQQKFGGQTAAPMLRAQQAPQIYGAQTDSIAATLAAGQNLASGISSLGSLAMSGASLYGGMQQTKAINNLSSKLTVPGGN